MLSIIYIISIYDAMADRTELSPCCSSALTLQINFESLEISEISGTRPVRLYSHGALQRYLVCSRKVTLYNVDMVQKSLALRGPFATCFPFLCLSSKCFISSLSRPNTKNLSIQPLPTPKINLLPSPLLHYYLEPLHIHY